MRTRSIARESVVPNFSSHWGIIWIRWMGSILFSEGLQRDSTPLRKSMIRIATREVDPIGIYGLSIPSSLKTPSPIHRDYESLMNLPFPQRHNLLPFD